MSLQIAAEQFETAANSFAGASSPTICRRACTFDVRPNASLGLKEPRGASLKHPCTKSARATIGRFLAMVKNLAQESLADNRCDPRRANPPRGRSICSLYARRSTVTLTPA